MFKGNGLIYIRHERNKGISKTDKEYDFANLTLSDGLESFKVSIEPYLCETPLLQNLKKGDKVSVSLEAFENFGKTVFSVTQIDKAS